DGGDVVGVVQVPRGDQPREQRVEVVVVGFGVAQFGRQRAVGVGGKHVFDLLGGDPGGLQERDPAVVLCGLGDGVVLGRELGDRAPAVLLGGDGLVCGQLGADVLQDAVED